MDMENPLICCRYILAIRFWIFSFVPVFGFLFMTHLIEGKCRLPSCRENSGGSAGDVFTPVAGLADSKPRS